MHTEAAISKISTSSTMMPVISSRLKQLKKDKKRLESQIDQLLSTISMMGNLFYWNIDSYLDREMDEENGKTVATPASEVFDPLAKPEIKLDLSKVEIQVVDNDVDLDFSLEKQTDVSHPPRQSIRSIISAGKRITSEFTSNISLNSDSKANNAALLREFTIHVTPGLSDNVAPFTINRTFIQFQQLQKNLKSQCAKVAHIPFPTLNSLNEGKRSLNHGSPVTFDSPVNSSSRVAQDLQSFLQIILGYN